MSERRWIAILALSLSLPSPCLDAVDEPATDQPKSLEDELPRLEPLEPEEALKSFQIHADFRLELVAAEPDVTDPVSLAFDEMGRMYVAEMPGYPYPPAGNPPTGRVRLLEDTDWDGTVDRSTIFADRLCSCPSALLPWRGGVFVGAAPDLLYLKDTDGDNVADVRQVVFTGFGAQKPQGLLNNFVWGLDNWIYGANGPLEGKVRPGERPGAAPVSLRRGLDFRFQPDSGEFETTSGGGQFGHTMDDSGNRFVCGNSRHMIQVVLPNRYLARNPYLAASGVIAQIAREGPAAAVYRVSPPEPWRVIRSRRRAAGQPPYTLVKNPDPRANSRYRPTELVSTGFFTAATGVTIYRGAAYPEPFRGNAFVGGAAGNLVHRKVLRPDGVLFSAKRADPAVEFLASRDNWFRPVNFANGPDGCLYVLDMYREVVEGHEFIYEDIKQLLDFTSGRDRGRIYRIVPRGFRRPKPPRLGSATTDELVASLRKPDGWWRDTAHRLLFERQDRSSAAPLRKLAHRASSPDPTACALVARGDRRSGR